MDTKNKRDRSANFSIQERDILVSLVKKYESVLESGQCDALAWKKKDLAWKNIENEFNAQSGFIFRSTRILKTKYEGLKRAVRKKSAALRSELHLTGGGKNSAPPLDNVEEQIKAMISLGTDSKDKNIVHDKLPQSEESQEVVIIVTNECEPWRLTSPETVPEEENTHLDIVNGKALYDTPSSECLITPTISNKKWNVTRRRNFKSRKHPALIGNLQKKTLFEKLTQAKLELVDLKKGFLEAEIIEKKKVWEFDKKIRSGNGGQRSTN